MLTELGKFLKKLRVDRNEVLKDMAGKLGVTASFLSAVENGKKRMPSEWNGKLCAAYSLDSDNRKLLTAAIADTEASIDLKLVDLPSANRELAVFFARRFSVLDSDQVKAIQKILRKDEKNRGEG
ncbi:MAG: helix-turn-helix transcriptional regulator [Oxalobacter sp.]|jgi:transcriptional regulator with XRE-family HTH domain|nr:helix-turn-helix transcriptional regulator [Oxalobacter sp.]